MRTTITLTAAAILLSGITVFANTAERAKNDKKTVVLEDTRQENATRHDVDADNTAANARSGLVAGSQTRGSDSDVELTRLARQRIVAEDALSTNAKNIKIITLNNVMTLRGPVKSAAEKNRVAELAKAAAPRVALVNKITVETVK